jgi:hypothetical protein
MVQSLASSWGKRYDVIENELLMMPKRKGE